MTDEASDRASLTSRKIDEMVLSTEDNSLTAPRPPPDGLSPVQRAQYRFQVKGNIVITGGTGTLALTTARALLEHGASGLALWDLEPERANTSLLTLHKDFPHVRITTCHVDLRSKPSIATALSDTIKVLGPLTHLINFAGIVSVVPSLSLNEETWRNTLDTNLTGSFLVSQALARHFVENSSPEDRAGGGGCIVLIASISAHATNFPQPQAAYNASKAGVVSLTKSLAAEWARYGIRVNCLSPGYMDTVLNEGEGLDNARRIWKERCPMGRMGHPWEITGPLVMLCGEGGRYVNGADLMVDGGSGVF
ncbi:2-deoxy-D-gluconate 3-dehydrogenase [Sporormia fimetaria CBS 119925]|uniref:2-deoxy-D-gluconate 3-dehydrogenase n=1 Tax=Sporormia fimetaria CBS 119925 TaxID=1340428 RepID=A0A6A6V4A6_9PLEO|nr:2-deoxy-D-gluconate 3-dehydrogenase [Sporormia fimetaria CBS 119925]